MKEKNLKIDTSHIIPVGDYDGTGKGGDIENLDVSSDYQWDNLSVISRQRLRESVLAKASQEAIDFLDVENYVTDIECDARELTQSQWQARRGGNRATGRLGTIGASSSAAVMGVSPYDGGTAVDLYHKVLGDDPLVPDEADPGRQHIFDVGHLAELYLQKKMEEYYPGCKVVTDTRVYKDPARNWLTANLDFMLQLSDGGWVHGEFKTTNPHSAKDWANGQIPPQYKTQIIQNQHLLNVDESRIVCAVLNPAIAKVPYEQMTNPNFDFEKFVDDIIVRNYIRDLDEEMTQLQAMDDFWYNNILPEIEPDLIGTEAQIKSAVRRWKGDSKPNTTMAIGEDMSGLCRALADKQLEIKRVKAELKRLEGELETASAPLKQLMGENIIGMCPDDTDPTAVFRVEYKPTKGRDSFKAAALKGDDPELYKTLVEKGYLVPAKKEAGRSFSVKLISEY